MATVFKSKKTGLVRVQFERGMEDGKRRRKTISLGRVTMKRAKTWLRYIDELIAASDDGSTPDRDTCRWVNGLSDQLYAKLVDAGLLKPRTAVTLKAFIDDYIQRRQVKDSTKTVWRRARRLLVNCFGENKPLREFTAGDAKDFRQYLLRQPGHGPKDADGNPPRMEEATVRTMCSRAKQFFEDAFDRGLIDRNPFKHRDVPTASKGNKDRQHFVSRTDADKVFAACPDAEWRLLFALCRYGGLRCPSETLRLCWDDIDWERGRFVVKSPKTEHHEGKDVRIVPIFPELLPYLEAAYDQAPEGARHVIATHRNANHRTLMLKIIERAGLLPWPKPFQNLRSTRQTELEEMFPRHVVCAWIGNSGAVAEKHYLQVTDDHFERALNGSALPYALPTSSATPRKASHVTPSGAKTRKKSHTRRTASQPMGDEGLEPPTSTL